MKLSGSPRALWWHSCPRGSCRGESSGTAGVPGLPVHGNMWATLAQVHLFLERPRMNIECYECERGER